MKRMTFISGQEFEDDIANLVSSYTRDRWRNIRIYTLLTENGTTEIDLLFYLNDIFYIVEAKNIAYVQGNYVDRTWTFTGAKTAIDSQYTALNTVIQNNLHLRAFKDFFRANFKRRVHAIPLIIIPDDCIINGDIQGDLVKRSNFARWLSKIEIRESQEHLDLDISMMLEGDCKILGRPDYDIIGGKPYMREGV